MGYFDSLMANPEADKAMPSFMTKPARGAPGDPPEQYAAAANVDANTGQVDATNPTFAGEFASLNDPSVPSAPGKKIGFLGFGEGGYFHRLANGGNVPGQNAEVSPTLATPRQPTANVLSDWEPGGSSAGIPARDGAAMGPPRSAAGPMSAAVDGLPGITRTGNSYSGVGAASTPGAPPAYIAQYAAMRAGEQQDARDAQMQNAAGNRAAVSSYDAENAARAARISQFRATNGADMVLAPENSGYDSQRRAIIAAAAADQNTATNLSNRAAADSKEAGGVPRSYIDEFSKTQDTLSRSQLAGNAGVTSGLDADVKREQLAAAKQLTELRTMLQNETDPAKIKVLQNKILAIEGKQPQGVRVAVIDVDTGAKDIMGQPIFKKAAIDVETGQMLGGGNQGGAKAVDPVAAIKALRPSEAEKYAKEAVATGNVSVEQVNQMLKAAGHAELK